MELLLTPKQIALVDARRGPRSRQQMVRMMMQDGLRYCEGHRFWQDLWHSLTADLMQAYGEEDFGQSPAGDAEMMRKIQADRLRNVIQILQDRLADVEARACVNHH